LQRRNGPVYMQVVHDDESFILVQIF